MLGIVNSFIRAKCGVHNVFSHLTIIPLYLNVNVAFGLIVVGFELVCGSSVNIYAELHLLVLHFRLCVCLVLFFVFCLELFFLFTCLFVKCVFVCCAPPYLHYAILSLALIWVNLSLVNAKLDDFKGASVIGVAMAF